MRLFRKFTTPTVANIVIWAMVGLGMRALVEENAGKSGFRLPEEPLPQVQRAQNASSNRPVLKPAAHGGRASSRAATGRFPKESRDPIANNPGIFARLAGTLALHAGFRDTPNPAPPDCEPCLGLGRVPGSLLAEIYEFNGCGDDPIFKWLPDGMAGCRLVAYAAQTNAAPAWLSQGVPGATVLMKDFGVNLGFDVPLPGFQFPFAGESYDTLGVTTSGRLTLGGMTHHRDGWPLASRHLGRALNTLAACFADWQLLPGSRIEVFPVSTNNIPGLAVRWVDMAQHGSVSTNRATFALAVYETGDATVCLGAGVEAFASVATIGAQSGGKHFVLHRGSLDLARAGTVFELRRLMSAHEAVTDEDGDSLSAIDEFLFFYDPQKWSSYNNQNSDGWFVAKGICGHSSDASSRSESIGAPPNSVCERYNLDPFACGYTSGDNVSDWVKIANGWDPRKQGTGVPDTRCDWVEFELKTAPGVGGCFTFSGMTPADEREERIWMEGGQTWLIQVAAWQGGTYQLRAPAGGTVRLTHTNYSMGIYQEGIEYPRGPMMMPMSAPTEPAFSCLSSFEGLGAPYPSRSFCFRPCYPAGPPYANQGYWVLFTKKYWGREYDQPMQLYHLGQFVEWRSEMAQAPCGCYVEGKQGPSGWPTYPGWTLMHGTATTPCKCVFAEAYYNKVSPIISIDGAERFISHAALKNNEFGSGSWTITAENWLYGDPEFAAEMGANYTLRCWVVQYGCTTNAQNQAVNLIEREVAELAINGKTGGVPLNNGSFNVSWDGIAQKSYGPMAGRDEMSGAGLTYPLRKPLRRVCPAIQGIAPPANYVIKAQVLRTGTTTVVKEATCNVKIPQVARVRTTAGGRNLLADLESTPQNTKPSGDGEPKPPNLTNMSPSEIDTFLNDVLNGVRSYYSDWDIEIVLESVSVRGDFKDIVLTVQSPTIFYNHPDCQGGMTRCVLNTDPSGRGEVYLDAIKYKIFHHANLKDLPGNEEEYKNYLFNNQEFLNWTIRTAVHELGHGLGLAAREYYNPHVGGYGKSPHHYVLKNGAYVMNDGQLTALSAKLGHQAITWWDFDKRYLGFVLGTR